MAYEWLDAYLCAKEGVVKDFKVEWNATRFLLGGKMIAMRGGDRDGKPIFTFKLEPAFGQLLRDQYACIVPGYYMNKVHWNSMYLNGNVPDDVVRDMADQTYALILQTLPKKVREAL